jgi:hypothetical protein
MDPELLQILARERQAELLRTAEHRRLAAAVRPKRSIRMRLGAVTLHIEVDPDYRARRSVSRST